LLLSFSGSLLASKLEIKCLRYMPLVIREARYYNCENYFHIFMGQIEQESGCNEIAKSVDDGKGIAQFIDITADWIHKRNSKLQEMSDKPLPYNPKWAIRAMIYYNLRLYEKTKCKGWYFALRAYNGGLSQINKEIVCADSCEQDKVEKCCSRAKKYCEINIQYPYKVFERAEKYKKYFGGI